MVRDWRNPGELCCGRDHLGLRDRAKRAITPSGLRSRRIKLTHLFAAAEPPRFRSSAEDRADRPHPERLRQACTGQFGFHIISRARANEIAAPVGKIGHPPAPAR